MTSAPRLAREDDLEAIQEVEIDAGALFVDVGLPTIADDDPPPIGELLGHLRDGALWVIADEHDRPVAYASASVVDDEGHLDQVSVRRASAGNGLGRLLIDEVCRWAAARGLHAVTLTTFRDVPFNGPLYQRYGFREIPDRDHGPELAAIRERERAAGIDVAPRIAMRRDI